MAEKNIVKASLKELRLAPRKVAIVASLVRGFEGGLLSEARFSILDWMIIGAVPLIAVFMTTLTSHVTVKRTLRRLV